MDKRDTATAYISCRAQPQDVRALAALAQERGQNKSQVLRALIREASQQKESPTKGAQKGVEQ